MIPHPLQLPPEGSEAHVAAGRRWVGRARRRRSTVGKVGGNVRSSVFLTFSQRWLRALVAKINGCEFLWLEIKCKQLLKDVCSRNNLASVNRLHDAVPATHERRKKICLVHLETRYFYFARMINRIMACISQPFQKKNRASLVFFYIYICSGSGINLMNTNNRWGFGRDV